MSTFKQIVLTLLVIVALIQTGIGGLRDMFGISIFGISSEHGWHDATILMLLAILLAIVMK